VFDTDLLRAFLTVLDTGGFTAAARRLNSTQSTVSAKLKRLEAQAGRRLLERTTQSGVTLTPAGETLVGLARNALETLERAHAQLQGAPLAGVVRIGMSDDFASGRGMTEALAAFARRHPEVALEVSVASSADVAGWMKADGLDLALTRRLGQEGEGEAFRREALAWAAHRDYVLDPDRPVDLVCLPAPCEVRRAATDALDKCGRAWRVAFSSPSLAGQKAALRARLGVAPLNKDLVDGDFRILDERDGLPPLGDAWLILHVRDVGREGAVAELARLLRRELEA